MIASERSVPLAVPAVRKNGWQAVLVGKGGAGKTTLTALLSLYAAREGEQVLAVDADPDTDLAYYLGVPIDGAKSLVPLARDLLYIQEKISAHVKAVKDPSSMVRFDVSDVLERSAITVRDRLRLLVTGNVETPVSECRCPEHILISAVFSYLAHLNQDAMIIDVGGNFLPQELFESPSLHALILARPRFNSLHIAETLTMRLLDQGVPHLYLVVNGIRSEQDVSTVKEFTTGLTCYEQVFTLPYDEKVHPADPDLSRLMDKDTPFKKEVGKIYRTLQGEPIVGAI
jgi:CO dehydrogenase maturation factor